MTILVLKPAPDFCAEALIDGKFKQTKLSDFKGNLLDSLLIIIGKYLVLVFYPLDFTFVCPTEIIAFNDRIKEFAALNTQIAVVSVDSVHSHNAWTAIPRNEGGLGAMDIPMISDIKKCISRKYKVLLEEEGFATRGTFIIDPQGILRHYSINEPPVGRSVDEVLRLLKAIQFTAKHGDVCPVNWQEGEKTMKADPKECKSYFAEKY